MTWTDTGWTKAVRLSAGMKEDGFKPVFPNAEMAMVDWYIYGNSTCPTCGVWTPLFPFWDGKLYRLYTVCMECGRVARKGGGDDY